MYTFPKPPGLSLALAALSRQGGAGGGHSCRMPLKSVGYVEVPRVAGAGGGWCFLRLEARLSFWAALGGEGRRGRVLSPCHCHCVSVHEPPSHTSNPISHVGGGAHRKQSEMWLHSPSSVSPREVQVWGHSHSSSPAALPSTQARPGDREFRQTELHPKPLCSALKASTLFQTLQLLSVTGLQEPRLQQTHRWKD